MERLPRLVFFPFRVPPRFALAFLRPAGLVARRLVFGLRFAERDELVFFADVFLRLPRPFFIVAFRDDVGFRAAAFFTGRLPSDEADVAFRAELVGRLAGLEVEVGAVDISLAELDGAVTED